MRSPKIATLALVYGTLLVGCAEGRDAPAETVQEDSWEAAADTVRADSIALRTVVSSVTTQEALRADTDEAVRTLQAEVAQFQNGGDTLGGPALAETDRQLQRQSGTGYVPRDSDVVSAFTGQSDDGWLVTHGVLFNPGFDGNTGGVGDGYLSTYAPSENQTSYFQAPPAYSGNWSERSELRFDIRSSGGRHYTEGSEIHGDVYITSGSAVAQRLLPFRPPAYWETFTIPLTDDGQWSLRGGASSLADVLGNVTELQIRAEYGVGIDTAGLDNVVLRSGLKDDRMP